MKKSRPRRAGPHNREIRQAGAAQMRRGGGLRRLPDLLSCLLDPAARRRGLAEAKLLTEWPTIVGPALAGRCQPIRLGNGTGRAGGVLVLHVAGAAALELQHTELQILERINGFFGYPAITRLRLIQAPPPRSSSCPERPAGRPVSAADQLDVRQAVQVIRDPGLRTALADLGRALKSRPHPGESGRVR
jgi:hypothetical protein